MPLEVANYLNDLTTTNPPSGDNVSQGDDHIRLLKSTLKASFPSISSPRYLELDGQDLASAAMPDLSVPTTDYINITGTTNIEGFAEEPGGFTRLLRFDDYLILRQSPTFKVTQPVGGDVYTMPGDHALVKSYGPDGWVVIWYMRANGLTGGEVDGGMLAFGVQSGSQNLDIDLSNFTNLYYNFRIRLIRVDPVTDGALLSLRTSIDGGANFSSGASDYQSTAEIQTSNLSASDDGFWVNNPGSAIILTPNVGISNRAVVAQQFDINLYDVGNTEFYKMIRFDGVYEPSTFDSIRKVDGAGYRQSVDALNAVRIFTSSGNFSGIWSLYGVN